MSYTHVIVRTVDQLHEQGGLWDGVPWQREEAEREYLLTRVRERDAAPFGLFVCDAGRPVAAAVGWIEQRPMPATFGYRVIYAPAVQVLQIVDGGLIATDARALSALANALRVVLRGREIEALALPFLPTDGDLYRVLSGLGSPLERQWPRSPGPRRRLVAPASFEEFLAGRSRKLRSGIRYDSKKLLSKLGGDVKVQVLRELGDLDRLVGDLEHVAAQTYQRALGAGFADTSEQRALARVGLAHGWVRAYVLYAGERPIAYWLCSLYRRSLLLRRTGFASEFAPHRPGIFLLMRVIEHACSDPDIDAVDFGQGDAAYKRQFSSECWHESDLVVFAPTLRGRRINITRGVVAASAKFVRRVLDATDLTDRVRSSWRRRLRRAP